MKTNKITVRGVGVLTEIKPDRSLELSNEQSIKDAMGICRFLLGTISSGTFNEVSKFISAFKKNKNLVSFSPEFTKYWEERLEELNNQDKLIDK